MKFPRNARMLKGHLDFAPFASVLFSLLIFLLLAALILNYSPGIQVHLPAALPGLSGGEGEVLKLAVTADGRLYYDNQPVDEKDLQRKLTQAVRETTGPVTLELYEDTNASTGLQMRVMGLSAAAGISRFVLETQPLTPGSAR